MKKPAFILLFFSLLLLFSFQASAKSKAPVSSGNVYAFEVNGAKVNVTFPSGLDIFTEDTKPDDPALAKYSLSWEELMRSFSKGAVRLEAIDQSMAYIISVIITDNPAAKEYPNLSLLTDSQLDKLIDQGIGDITGFLSSTKFSWTAVGDYKYFYFEIGTPPDIYVYCTTVNGAFVMLELNQMKATAYPGLSHAIERVVEGVSIENPSPVSAFSAVFISMLPILAFILPLVALLVLLTLWLKRKLLRIEAAEYYNLDKIGGALIYLIVRISLGMLIQIGQLSLMSSSSMGRIMVIILVFLEAGCLILLLMKKRAFIFVYFAVVGYYELISFFNRSYAYSAATGFVEVLLIIYLLTSRRVAIVYQTRQVEIIKPEYDPVAVSAAVIESLPPTPEEAPEDSVAHFPSRAVDEITCPICRRIQMPNRSKCFKCGCKFIYDDEISDTPEQ